MPKSIFFLSLTLFTLKLHRQGLFWQSSSVAVSKMNFWKLSNSPPVRKFGKTTINKYRTSSLPLEVSAGCSLRFIPGGRDKLKRNNPAKNKLNRVTLGALLHDIGKFVRRATKENKAHQCLTDQFLKEHGELLEAFGVEVDYVREIAARHHCGGERDIRASKCHREICNRDVPFDGEEFKNDVEIVKKADQLSSGHERVEVLENIDEDQNEYRPLFPIFMEVSCESIDKIAENVQKEGREGGASKSRFVRKSYLPDALTVDAVFPVNVVEKAGMEESYRNLYNRFLRDWINLKEKVKKYKEQFNQNFEALKSLLLRYLWAVPSNTYSMKNFSVPDIPLADHLFTSSAIATALKAYHEVEGYDSLSKENLEKFVLLSVDFSGIQSFIFQKSKETKKWASKILRARSFMVSLALESVIRKFTDTFGVNTSVVFLNAGGKALLLLPKYSDTEERIEEVRREIKRALLQKFYGQIKIKIAYVYLTENDLKLENFQRKLGELHEAETEARFKLFGSEDFNLFVSRDYAKKVSKSGGVCHICGIRPVDKGAEITKKFGVPVCSFCNWLIEKGEKLPKVKYVLLDFGSSKWFPLPDVKLLEREDKLQSVELNEEKLLISLNASSFEGLPVKFIENYIPLITESEVDEYSEKFPEKLRVIEEEYRKEKLLEKGETLKDLAGKPKTFGHIALESLREENGKLFGKPFLGVLKADVDRLGFIFISGFATHKRDGKEIPLLSISRFAALSRMLDYFFTEVIKEKLIKTKYRNIYSVFSGGDDLFLIGPWEEVIKFTEDMRALFYQYVCENRNMTISAGVELLKPTLPVEFIAEKGEGALGKAKKWRSTISVMGKRIPYVYTNDCCKKDEKFGERFKNPLMNLRKLLSIAYKELPELLEKELLEEGKSGLSTAFLYKLLQISEMANKIVPDKEEKRKFSPDNLNRNLMWRVYLYYLFARAPEFRDNLEEVVHKFTEYIEVYSENLSEEESERIDNLFYIPLAIAIYRRRKYGRN